MARKGPTKVSSPGRPSFVMGSRPPDLYAPRVAPRPQGNILKQPPNIAPGAASTRQYGKGAQAPAQAGGSYIGNTGLTDES